MSLQDLASKMHASQELFNHAADKCIRESNCDEETKRVMVEIIAQVSITFEQYGKAIVDYEKNK